MRTRFAVRWVVPEVHGIALARRLAGRRRAVSLVDEVSFEVMRRESLTQVFAFDEDFATEGFDVVPG